MSDMIVRLYDLPEFNYNNEKLLNKGIDVRRAMAPDKSKVVQFVKENFSDHWASECDVSFSNKPISCFIAVKDKKEIIGFACYEATCKNFFGPIGVLDKYRHDGLGKSLFIYSLLGLKEMGYSYCIIGGGSSIKDVFYNRIVDVEIIPKSDPGIYKDMIG